MDNGNGYGVGNGDGDGDSDTMYKTDSLRRKSHNIEENYTWSTANVIRVKLYCREKYKRKSSMIGNGMLVTHL